MNAIKVSIIVPCYNQAKYLDAALQSVFDQTYTNWECIIVNDGSTDSTEEIALRWIKKDERFKYYAKQNEGLGKTRNYGIAKSNGSYILPLDSDNQLIKDFMQDAISVFEKNQNIGVVYGDAEYFGERNGLWKVDDFNLEKILFENYIDACAMYKKSLWDDVGGYDENIPFQGIEDWDFWIALGVLNIKFHYLNKITFKYYVSNASMIRSFTQEMHEMNNDYVFKKYSKQYQKHYRELYLKNQKIETEHFKILKSEKFVIDLFCNTFFGFKIFNRQRKL